MIVISVLQLMVPRVQSYMFCHFCDHCSKIIRFVCARNDIVCSTVIASNLLLVDEIMRAGMTSLKG